MKAPRATTMEVVVAGAGSTLFWAWIALAFDEGDWKMLNNGGRPFRFSLIAGGLLLAAVAFSAAALLGPSPLTVLSIGLFVAASAGLVVLLLFEVRRPTDAAASNASVMMAMQSFALALVVAPAVRWLAWALLGYALIMIALAVWSRGRRPGRGK